MSVFIKYFVHGTTLDNEQGLCTGWEPGELSDLGIRQAKELGGLVKGEFDAFFVSDLRRAVDSAQLGFGGEYEFVQDKRLRECNYGDFTRKSEHGVNYESHIDKPFPNGESLKDVERRISDFISYLKQRYNNKHIAIMAHKAPQLALEVLLNGKTWSQAIETDWRKTGAWRSGWEYQIQ